MWNSGSWTLSSIRISWRPCPIPRDSVVSLGPMKSHFLHTHSDVSATGLRVTLGETPYPSDSEHITSMCQSQDIIFLTWRKTFSLKKGKNEQNRKSNEDSFPGPAVAILVFLSSVIFTAPQEERRAVFVHSGCCDKNTIN